MSSIFNRFEQQSPHLSSDAIGCILPRGSDVNYVFPQAKVEEKSEVVLSLDNQDSIDTATTDVNEPKSKKDVYIGSASLTQRSSRKPVKRKTRKHRKSTPERREQCRLNQERYRKKQAERKTCLAIHVNELRDEVPLLEIQHTRMSLSRHPTVWAVVAEYFHLFRHGTDQSQTRRQAAFLRSTMASDVIIGSNEGVDALLEQWCWYSAHFGDLQFQLKSATQSSQLVWASSVLEMTITDTTLAKVFPHLSDGGFAGSLRSRLLRRRLVLPCRLCFEWDEDSNRVVRLETTVDFIDPLHKLLGSLGGVGYVLERAHLL
eukprot:jgi/Phyca11/540569/estExt2_Genewise1Plus.C_PHYCAscaffold_50221